MKDMPKVISDSLHKDLLEVISEAIRGLEDGKVKKHFEGMHEKLKKQERKIFGCVTCSGNVATNDDWGFGGIARNWANKIQEATG